MKIFSFQLGIPIILLSALLLTAAKKPHQGKLKYINKPAKTEVKVIATPDSSYHENVRDLYNTIKPQAEGLNYSVFEQAITGFYNLKKAELTDKPVIGIVDFDKLSTDKRFYIIDIAQKEVLLNTWVAHGIKSGKAEAEVFSNKINSNASSLGFYITGETYYGKHGKSLRLDGLDEGFNSNARSRAIVVHAAAYVDNKTINALGYLGRSHGCPAVAPAAITEVLNHLGDNNMLFIHKSDSDYQSDFLDKSIAADFMQQEYETNVD